MRPTNSLLGIDINSQAVKLVELNYIDGHYPIKKYAIASLPAGVVVGKTIVDKKSVVKAIKFGLRQITKATRQAIVAIPNHAVKMKLIHLNDSLTESEIEKHIFFEADRYFETPLQQIYLDFIVLGKSRAYAKQIDVLVIAGQRAEVEIRAEIIKGAGLKLVAVDVESLALIRAIKSFYQSNLMLVQVEPQSLLMGIFIDNNLIHLHAEQWQSDQDLEFIIQQIQRQLQIIALQVPVLPAQIVLSGDQANSFLVDQLYKKTQIPTATVGNLIGDLSPALIMSYGLALWLFA